MYLSKLEIIGFKSFPHKTIFKFSDGLTAFVGPNGCGKTNIIDAIRWVLGEQKSSVLRANIMEEVIFIGTSSRKPLGMAEVSITIQNNKQVLPTEYNEVTVSRRLFRNGESAYLLNNTQCRLRDILDLFMDTGIGADTYSVIELKMVEDILNGKPEERRHLIEEAAGVTRYKSQRKEAGKKLTTVEGDLVRVRDIFAEVQKNVNSLSRQASKTRRYNAMLDEMKQHELKLAHHEFASILTESQNYLKELENLKSERINYEKELTSKEAYIAGLKESATELESQHEIALHKENSINSSIADKSREKAVTEEKINSLNNAKERITEEIAESSEQNKNLQNELENSKSKLKQTKQEKELFTEELKSCETIRDESQLLVQDAREKFNGANEAIVNLQGKIDSLNKNLERNKSRQESLAESIESGKNDVSRINNEISDIDKQSAEAVDLQKNLIKKSIKAESEYATAKDKKQKLEVKIEETREQLSGLKNELNKKNAELEFISGIVDSDESTKYLMHSEKWKLKSEKILLAEAIGADEQHRIAVDAALGDAVRYFVVNTRKEALEGIKELNENEKGKAYFLCRELIPQVPAPENIIAGNGTIGWLSEIVRVDDTLRNALRAILGKTLLVNELSDAINAIEKKIADCAVTLTGELVKAKGIIRGGSVSKTEGLTVGKKERTNLLNKEISGFGQKINKIETQLSQLKNEFDSIDLILLGENTRKTESDKNSNEQTISQLNFKKDSILENLKLYENNISLFSEELLNIENENNNYNSELENLELKVKSEKENQQKLFIGLKETEEQLTSKEALLRDTELKNVRFEEDIKNLEKEASSIASQIQSLKDRDKKNHSEIEKISEDSKKLSHSINKIENELTELQKDLDDAQNESELLHEQIQSKQEELSQHNNELSSFRKSFDKIIEQMHQLELKLGEYNMRKNTLIQHFEDDYKINIETSTMELEENFSLSDARIAIRSIKEKLSSFGSVNFMALEEYEEQSQRFVFLTKQLNDLEESKKNLEDTISEINETAEKQFRETFELVNSHFKNIFVDLFGNEAAAGLILEEGDPLESNINIIAKPPGKKPHSIDSLSGGEKTLTAIALLFSIYLVKPSPFCILDEVDAPLSDTNIDIFINLIRKFSNNTQFIIITHNKRTMEAADYLYGVTMQEKGITKVVSVRLKTAESI